MRRLISIIIAAMIATVYLASSTIAQQPSRLPQQQQLPTPTPSSQEMDKDEVVRIDTELVTLTATVTDQHGRNRADLKRSDFTVYEDGVKQQLAYFNAGDPTRHVMSLVVGVLMFAGIWLYVAGRKRRI